MPETRERIIDVGDLEPNFRNEILAEPGGERFMRCFSCGTCVAGCPVAGMTEKYNPRRIVRMALLGMRQEVLASEFVWLCSTCYTCYERCPQDVHIPDLMNAIRNIAVREGHVPPAFRQQAELLRDHGRLYEITNYENQRRQEAGLPPIQERGDEVRRILVRSGVLEEVES
ncbi:MAG: 4Fe-4S dicluster domain-containing protein [Anaerolineae bacterium]|nr:4Fe-4S dicluster domain-containing protein [Anaerolineae bacterium]